MHSGIVCVDGILLLNPRRQECKEIRVAVGIFKGFYGQLENRSPYVSRLIQYGWNGSIQRPGLFSGAWVFATKTAPSLIKC
jgi:hypothetical protein